jgi:hypothetical protein
LFIQFYFYIFQGNINGEAGKTNSLEKLINFMFFLTLITNNYLNIENHLCL